MKNRIEYTLENQMTVAKARALQEGERINVVMDKQSGRFMNTNFDELCALNKEERYHLGFYAPSGRWIDSNNGN